MSSSSDSARFASLGRPRRIWAIGAVHAEIDRLIALHDHIAGEFSPGDRLVYLGNLVGRGAAVTETVAEILSFRRELLALPGMLVSDIVYLRGAQEEMWQKLLQLQFAPNPRDVLQWMLGQGVAETLHAYGGGVEEGLAAARDGAVQLTRWTNRLRGAMRDAPGHVSLYSALRRAAYTEDGRVLFVSAGIDPARPLSAQGDSFWWGGGDFAGLSEPFFGVHRVVRGFDPARGGVAVGDIGVTLDAGCGHGGKLAAARIDPQGQIRELIEV
ncbi:MAG: hypothetical protein HKM95_10715 [Inquilinus sp.]|nr:hypothetical protein [Inquilinus sp.]